MEESLYIRDKIKYKLRTDVSIFHEGIIESCFIEMISKNSKNIIIGELYRVPGTNEDFFLTEYEKLLNEKKF
jgi:hypothetical protein